MSNYILDYLINWTSRMDEMGCLDAFRAVRDYLNVLLLLDYMFL